MQDRRKGMNKWAEENPRWTLRENSEAFTSFQTMILVVKKSVAVPQKIGDKESLSDACTVTTPAKPATVQAGSDPCAGDWSDIETKRLNSIAKNSNSKE